MLRLNAIACAIALSAFPAGAGPPPAGPRDIPADVAATEAASAITAEQLALQRDRYERVTIPVTIQGQGPYRFLVDTGAQVTVLSHRVVEELQIEPTGRATLVAMGSQRSVDTFDLDGLEFANRVFSGLMAPLLHRQDIGADGILGLDSLQDLRVLIDFEEGRMDVADAETLGGNSGYEIVVRARRQLGQMIITDAKIDGIRTAVIIDTGAQNTIANLALRRRLRGRDTGHQSYSTDVLGAELAANVFIAKRLTIGRMEMNNVPLGYAESPVFASLGLGDTPAIILGMRNMRVFRRVAIDFSSQRVLFDLPRGAQSNDIGRQIFNPTRLGST